jgi:ParB family transcriptional regulator, chromosome partitioning protein
MNTPAKPELLLIPLSQLRDSKSNVRKTGGLAIAELAESIYRVGLLHNLNVTIEANGKFYGVVAGRRRRAALKLLLKQQRITDDFPVLCRVVAGTDATTVSLTENIQREAMHPADQFDAFAKLIAEGKSIEDIAADFGVSPLSVRQRLKLANVSPRLIAEYRAGEATLEQLMALAIVDDHGAQEAAYFDAPEWQRSPDILREHLTANEIDARTDRVAKFVGASQYEAAGGVIRRDLFAENAQDGFMVDSTLLDRLARDKLELYAVAARKQGWAWVDVAPRCAGSELSNFQRARRERREPKAQEAKRLADIESACGLIDERIAELENIESETEQEATQDEYDRLQRQRETLENKRLALEDKLMRYAPDVMALAGAVITLDYQGSPVTHFGLLRAADAQALRCSERKSRSKSFTESNEPEQKQGISEALARKLSSHRTAALQIELARQPQIALVALVHRLTLQLLYQENTAECGVQINGALQNRLANYVADIETAPAALAFAELQQVWRERLPEDPTPLFAILLALTQDDLLALLALCVASTLDVISPREDSQCGDDMARALKLDIRNWWTATAASYFGQISKSKIVEAVQSFSPAQAGHIGTLKKTMMATEAERLATGTGWLPPMMVTPQ